MNQLHTIPNIDEFKLIIVHKWLGQLPATVYMDEQQKMYRIRLPYRWKYSDLRGWLPVGQDRFTIAPHLK